MNFDANAVLTATHAWHAPRCSVCDQPIEDAGRAHAGWFLDGMGALVNPVVFHTGPECPRRLGDSLQDNPIVSFRRDPMRAVAVMTRARLSTKADRAAWSNWLSIVLGLPIDEDVGDDETPRPADRV